MQRKSRRTREIRFRSEKNQQIIAVHTEVARKYAELLEQDPKVLGYQASILLVKDEYIHVNRIRLRKNLFTIDWMTDFLITFDDRHLAVRELITELDLAHPSTLEALELSRRYWTQQNIQDWNIVLIKPATGRVM